MRCLVLVLVCAIAGCKTGGNRGPENQLGGVIDHGETNGRRLDFVSNKPEQDDWQIRITGSSMWVSYARESSADELGSVNLTDKETRKLWTLIDALDIPNRKPGKKDQDEGYVSLQLKQPGGEDGRQIYRVYISRAANDGDLIALATYLQDLAEKYKKERPHF